MACQIQARCLSAPSICLFSHGLLAGQVYLTHNFAFDLEAGNSESKKSVAESDRIERIDFYFSLAQKHRLGILDWIESGPADHAAGAVLEDVIAALTSKAKLGGTLKAREVPRSWRSLSSPGCRGRLCPDTEMLNFKSAISKADAEQDFEAWLQVITTAAVGTEINVQLGTFTLQSNQTELLDSRFVEAAEFETAIGIKGPQRLQCAKVLRTQHCEHVKLMFRHDLHYWEPDRRKPVIAFSYPGIALPDWISAGLRKLPEEYRSVSVRFESVSGGFVRGQFTHEDVLLEVALFKTFRGTHLNLFKVVSYGRRFLRSLVFSSSDIFSFHDMSPSLTVSPENSYEVCCGKGNLSQLAVPDPACGAGLVVTRNLSIEIEEQVYVPRRFLEGIIPSSLLGADIYTV